MRRIWMVTGASLALGCTMLASSAAHAAVVVVAPGTPETEQGVVVGSGIHPGTQVEAHAGSGFGDLYNLGIGGRLGYTTSQGIYLGGAVDHFIGRDVIGSPHNTLAGGEAGLKIFPNYRWELRPYGFVGADIPSNGSTQLAIAPGLVGAYHFGQGFVDLDGRVLLTPGPTTFMLFGGGGIGF
jgi:hypothetical protein